MSEEFYVGIKGAARVRRDLLTSSRSILDWLRNYEAYRRVREEKLNHIIKLKHIADEIVVLNKKLRRHLPKVPIMMMGDWVRTVVARMGAQGCRTGNANLPKV